MVWKWNHRERAWQRNVDIIRAQQWNALITREQQQNVEIMRAWQNSQLSTLLRRSPPLLCIALHNQNKFGMIYVFFSFFVCAQVGIKIMTQTLVFRWCLWKFQNESIKITTSKTTLSNCNHNLIPNVLVGILPHTYLKAYPRTISDDSMLVFSWT